MGFFPEPPDPARPTPLDRPPVWVGAPDDMLPGVVPIELVLGRSDNAVVQFTAVRAFPTGLQISMAVRVRNPNPRSYLADLYGGRIRSSDELDLPPGIGVLEAPAEHDATTGGLVAISIMLRRRMLSLVPQPL